MPSGVDKICSCYLIKYNVKWGHFLNVLFIELIWLRSLEYEKFCGEFNFSLKLFFGYTNTRHSALSPK